MTGRTPACEDSAAIGERLRELQAERMAAIAGCLCGTLGPAQHDVAGNLVHAPQCPLRAPPQEALALAVAMERLRARHKRRAADAEAQSELAFERAIARIDRTIADTKRMTEEIERATEAMAARRGVLS